MSADPERFAHVLREGGFVFDRADNSGREHWTSRIHQTLNATIYPAPDLHVTFYGEGSVPSGLKRRRPYRSPSELATALGVEAGEEESDELVLVDLAEVEAREVEWLWEGRIPRGMVTLLAGDPGDGKSYVAMALAAAVTRGEGLALDEVTRSVGDVILVSYEDAAHETLRPRADSFGFGPGRIRLVTEVKSTDGKTRIFTADDVAALDAAVEATPKAQLLVIDPVGSFLPGKIDSGRDNAVRSVLSPLAALAERYGIAVLVVMHLNKDQLKQILYRVSGSVAFVGVARSVLLVGQEPQSGRRAVAHPKHNLTPEAVPVEFTITGHTLTWIGEAPDLRADRLVAAPSPPDKQKAAEEWLEELIGNGRPLLVETIKKRAEEAGHKWHTVRRAADALDVEKTQAHERGKKGGGPWSWHLGEPPEDDSA